jgi:7-keto-8-aminopelargonate synthetase-like enzyme
LEIHAHPEWLATLADKSARLKSALHAAGLDTLQSASHIVPVLIGDNARAVAIATRLKAEGFLVAAIRPPTVPPGTARLRLSVSLAHSDAELSRAADAITRIVRETP